MKYKVVTFANRKHCWSGEVNSHDNNSAYGMISERHGLHYTGSNVVTKKKQQYIIILMG